jgi:hypothetical protein
MMKKLNLLIILFLVIATTSCKKYLDVNNNPNGPSSADPALYLPGIQTWAAQGIQWDARGLGPVDQNFVLNSTGLTFSTIERHGYLQGSDNSGDLWRTVYWRFGQNLQDVLRISAEQKKWDILAAGLAMEAWGYQMLTDYTGEIIVKQAFDPTKNTFDYDPQDTVYAVIKRQLQDALVNIDKTTDAIGSPLFTKYDMMYKGNRDNWKKFINAMLAINEHHLIKKASYDPQAVINFVDNSFSSNADDALVPFLGSSSSDANFFGPMRGNMQNYNQSSFVVRLMDGTVFTGTPDPRRLIMLTPSTDGVYRGLAPYTGQSSAVATSPTGVKNIWGVTSGTIPPLGTGKYLFKDNAPFPLITYSMLQFIKAEAALKKGDNATALDAYKKGINASLDMVRKGTTAPGSTPTGGSYVFSTDPAINAQFDAEKSAFLANPLVVPANPADLTIQQIMLQKYIALWGYGFVETWVDLRKFDYDPNIFLTFQLPSPLWPDNNGVPMYRVRPRYNSEYVWNIDALTKIGGFEPNFHTKKMWIQLP